MPCVGREFLCIWYMGVVYPYFHSGETENRPLPITENGTGFFCLFYASPRILRKYRI